MRAVFCNESRIARFASAARLLEECGKRGGEDREIGMTQPACDWRPVNGYVFAVQSSEKEHRYV